MGNGNGRGLGTALSTLYGQPMTEPDVQALIEVRRATRNGLARALRVAAGLSQEEVAGQCGVTRGAVSRWERGHRTPRGEGALLYARLIAGLRSGEGS